MKKPIVFISILLLALSFSKSSYGANPIDALQSGEWYEVPGSQLQTVAWPSNNFSLSYGGGTSAIINAWNGGAYDITRDRFIIWGGGHNDYPGNEIYAFDINTFKWTRVNDPSFDVGGVESSGVYPDGKPRSRHTYNYIQYVPSIDRFCTFGGAGLFPSGQVTIPRTDCFDFNTLNWERKADTLAYDIGAVSAYDADNNKIWVVGGGVMASWNIATDTWVKHGLYSTFAPFPDGIGYSTTAAYRPRQGSRPGQVLIVGRGGTRVIDVDSVNPKMTALQTSGDTTIETTNNAGFDYDPTTDSMVAWNGGTDVYILDSNNVWTKHSASPTNTFNPGAATANGQYGRWRYVSSKNVFIGVTGVSKNVFVYKLSSGSGTPLPPDITFPTVFLTSPTNNSIVSGTITVSANAADNIGVDGVQFKLDGANLGAEDTTSPYSISWNTTQTTNGIHILTATARDAAGNQTTSSAITITVNNISDTTAPSIPANLAATAISSSQINISWNASTDNVGVTGYKIYRCTGSTCAPTTQIATSNTASYSNTGLAASTAYAYVVSAFDAAGNESRQSASASATTQVSIGKTYYISPSGSDANDGSEFTPWATLSKAFSQMQGGDTLIIKDGIYKGIPNAMNDAGSTVYPPNGSEGNYTIIRAENEGQVIFDGEGIRTMFYLGNSPKYLQFQGIKWINPSGDISVVLVSRGNHIKILRSGAGNNITNRGETLSFNIMRSSYVLLEDVYAWGGGRYKFAFFLSDHIICRRCVARTDATTGVVGTIASVIAVFQNYCSQYVEYQNSIAIDTDTPEYWTNYYELHGGFTAHSYCDPPADEYSENTDYRGSIALNVKQNSVLTADTSRNFSFRDFVGWDTLTGFYPRTPMAPYNYSINHSLFGNMSTDDGIMDYNNNTVVTNSIFYKNKRYGLGGVANSNYNSLYFNGTDYFNTSPGPNDLSAANGNAINPITGTPGNGVPALKYLLRVENGSDLDGAASDGGDIGPTILKKIGVSGTLYGEPGYNEVTNEDLWPFPYEDQIKSAFASYNPGGTDPTKPNGKRGFAADENDQFGKPLTLTRYIWQYLGNQIPCEIYNECGLPSLKGDVNSDNSVDILDIQALVNHILGIQDLGMSADVNGDGLVDVLDVQEVVNIILVL